MNQREKFFRATPPVSGEKKDGTVIAPPFWKLDGLPDLCHSDSQGVGYFSFIIRNFNALRNRIAVETADGEQT